MTNAMMRLDELAKFFDIEEEEEAEEEIQVDPKVMAFLETEDFDEKYEILTGLHSRITKEQIGIMAISLDLTIDDGECEDMYRQLKTCVETRRKFETTRLR